MVRRREVRGTGERERRGDRRAGEARETNERERQCEGDWRVGEAERTGEADGRAEGVGGDGRAGEARKTGERDTKAVRENGGAGDASRATRERERGDMS